MEAWLTWMRQQSTTKKVPNLTTNISTATLVNDDNVTTAETGWKSNAAVPEYAGLYSSSHRS